MKNELMQMPVNDMMTMAKTFAESGMFDGARQLAQAFVKIQAGQELGIPPFAAMSGIHIIKGKPTIGAGLMASQVKGSGKYDYEVKEHSDKICSLDFYQGKKLLGNSTFTIEEARKAGTQNMDKFPKNMLFARALSNGVKWFTPDVFTGPVYTPEEMQATTEDAPQQLDGSYAAPAKQELPSPAGLPILTNPSKKYDLVVERLNNCTTTVTQVKTFFTLTKEMEEELNAIEKAAQTPANEPAPVE